MCAPTEGSDDVVKDRFYQTVEGVDNTRSNYDIKMVIRDLNVKLDKKIHTVELLENIAYVWKLTIMDRGKNQNIQDSNPTSIWL